VWRWEAGYFINVLRYARQNTPKISIFQRYNGGRARGKSKVEKGSELGSILQLSSFIEGARAAQFRTADSSGRHVRDSTLHSTRIARRFTGMDFSNRFEVLASTNTHLVSDQLGCLPKSQRQIKT